MSNRSFQVLHNNIYSFLQILPAKKWPCLQWPSSLHSLLLLHSLIVSHSPSPLQSSPPLPSPTPLESPAPKATRRSKTSSLQHHHLPLQPSILEQESRYTGPRPTKCSSQTLPIHSVTLFKTAINVSRSISRNVYTFSFLILCLQTLSLIDSVFVCVAFSGLFRPTFRLIRYLLSSLCQFWA